MRAPRRPSNGSRWLLAAAGFGATIGCASGANDFDTESHFVCGSDADCAAQSPVARCVAGQCAVPDFDLSDPRSATTPDCVEAPCTGELLGVYRVIPPAGVEWRPGEPLLSTTPGGSVVLLLEETSENGPRRVGVASFAADLSEKFWSWREAFAPPGTNLRGSLLFPNAGGIVLVEYRSVEAGGNLARITALDEAATVSLERTADLPEGIFLMDVSASGAVTMIRLHNVVGVDGPAHPDCPSKNALLVNEPDNALSVLRCPEGVNFGRFESSPSGYMLGGGVHGEPPGAIQADLGDGAVMLDKGAQFLARYDRKWQRVWTRSFDNPAGIEGGLPAPGGGEWALLQGGDANAVHGLTGLPPDPYGVRHDLVYLEEDGSPGMALGREGETHGDLSVDGAGHAVVLVAGESSPEGVPAGWAEIRKILRDGSTAWRIPMDTGGSGLAVGPSGDVYFAVHPSVGMTVVVGNETVVGPELAVFRFAP